MALTNLTIEGYNFDLPEILYTFTEQLPRRYVDPVNGNNAYNGLFPTHEPMTFQGPWQTLEYALAQQTISDWDVLECAPGTYEVASVLMFGKSGTASRPTVVCAKPGYERQVIIQPAQSYYTNPALLTGKISSFDIQKRYIILHGLDIRGYKGLPNAPAPTTSYDSHNALQLTHPSVSGQQYVKFLNCVFAKGWHCGIKDWGHGGTGILVEGCILWDNGHNSGRDHGIYIAHPDGSWTVRGCVFFNNAGAGVQVYTNDEANGSTYNHVYNCQFFGGHRWHIMVQGAYNEINHNVVVYGTYGNGPVGIQLRQNECHHNFFQNNVGRDMVAVGNSHFGLDAGGGDLGNPLVAPHDNTLNANITPVAGNWVNYSYGEMYLPPGADVQYHVPTFVDYRPADKVFRLKLHSSDPGIGTAVPAVMRNCLPHPDRGIFDPAGYYDAVASTHRLSKAGLEVLGRKTSNVRLTHVPLEILGRQAANARIAWVGMEVLTPEEVAPANNARLTGMGLEVLGKAAGNVRLSHAALEVLTKISGGNVRVSEIGMEVLTPLPETAGAGVLFDEVRFPETYALYLSGGPAFNTTILADSGGQEQRWALWSRPLWKWQLDTGELNAGEKAALLQFFGARYGRLRGFRFQDPLDHEVLEAAPEACLPVGNTGKIFQLVKRYTNGGQTLIRVIQKPVNGTVKIWNGENLVGTGYSVDHSTGKVTFNSTPGYTPGASFEFDVPVRFGTDTLEMRRLVQGYAQSQRVPIEEIRLQSSV